MSRFRDNKRRARGDLHQEMSVPALYIAVPTATPLPCNVRVWLKGDPQMLGTLPLTRGTAESTEPEDRLRFDLSEIPMIRRSAVVSVEVGEAYRIELLYPADLGYATAKVTRLSADEATGLPVPVVAP